MFLHPAIPAIIGQSLNGYRTIGEERSIKITFCLLPAEHESIMGAAKFLYEHGAIPRLTAGTYARAAALLIYNELSARSTKAQ